MGNGSMEVWKYGSMEVWKYGRMERWKNGKMEYGHLDISTNSEISCSVKEGSAISCFIF